MRIYKCFSIKKIYSLEDRYFASSGFGKNAHLKFDRSVDGYNTRFNTVKPVKLIQLNYVDSTPMKSSFEVHWAWCT